VYTPVRELRIGALTLKPTPALLLTYELPVDANALLYALLAYTPSEYSHSTIITHYSQYAYTVCLHRVVCMPCV
jgi:hypothetical protein